MIRSQRAFTLIEILIAMAIITIALVTILNVVGMQIENTTRVQDSTIAHWVGENILARLQLGLLNTEDSSGDTQMLEESWRWTTTSKATANPAILTTIVNIYPANTKKQTPLATINGFIFKRIK